VAISERDKQQFLAEHSGPPEYYIYCGTHGYFGAIDKPPISDCSKCWQVYFIQRYLEVPPSERKEFLEKLTDVVRYSAESVKRGDFDVRLFKHPKVEIQRDVPDGELDKLKE